MLLNEARNLLVEAYEKTHDAKAVALAYGVSVPTVYRLAEQKAKTGSADLRGSKQGRKRVLMPEDSERIAKVIDSQPDITLSEIVEKLSMPVEIETVRRRIQAMGYRRKRKMIHASKQERPRCAGQEGTMEWVFEDNTGFPSGFPSGKRSQYQYGQTVWPGTRGTAGGSSRAAEYTKIHDHFDLYAVFCEVLYVVQGGIQWRMLPSDYPKWQGVYFRACSHKPKRASFRPIFSPAR